MIGPDDIRRKAENLYRDFLQAWLAGDEYFPRVIRGNKVPESDLANTIQSVRRLRDESKEGCGFGYTVEWKDIRSRKFGHNRFPYRIIFETIDDYLRFIGKEREFRTLADAVEQLRLAFPQLERWIRSNARAILDLANDLEGLLHVLRYFQGNPRPDVFAREIPVPVDTKFVERHQRVLRDWLDRVMPPHTIRADEEHFERRFGLRYVEPQIVVRVIDDDVQAELGWPCSVLSVPLHTLVKLQVADCTAIIVENKVNLFTLPTQKRWIGLGGLGRGVELLRCASWLSTLPIIYWGDLDIEGFQILSRLRALFPQTKSLLMDKRAVEEWRHLAINGSGREAPPPANLTPGEKAAFLRCASSNLRIEQERIPQREISSRVAAWTQYEADVDS